MTNKELLNRITEIVENFNLYKCGNCGRLAYMIDPGDGIVTHLSIKEDGTLLESEIN